MTSPVPGTVAGPAIAGPAIAGPAIAGPAIAGPATGAWPLADSSPLEGLDRRRLGFTSVLAQSVSATAPAAVMATVPGLVAAQAGGGAAVACYAAALVLVLAVADAIGAFAGRVPAAGGLYTYAARGLGPVAGAVAGVGLLVGHALIGVAAQIGAVLYAASALRHAGLFPSGLPGGAGSLAVAAPLVAACAAALAARGIALSSRLALVLEAVSIGGLLTVLGAAVLAPSAGPAAVALGTGHQTGPAAGWNGIVAGVVLAVGGFTGFESAACLGAEARDPLRAVPRAVRRTALAAGLLYVVATWASTGLPVTGAAGAAAGLWLDVPGLPGGTAWVSLVLDAGIAASFAACAVASSNAFARVLFSMGREGVVPRVFGTTHPRHRTPARSLAVLIPVSVAVCLPPALAGARPDDLFEAVLALGTFGTLLAYTLVAAAAPVFLRRIGEWSRRTAVTSAVGAAAGAGTLTWGLATFTLRVPGLPPVPVAFALAVVVGGIWFAVVHRARPGRLARMGVYDQSTCGDLLPTGAGLRDALDADRLVEALATSLGEPRPQPVPDRGPR